MLKSLEPALSELTMVMQMTGDCQSLVTAKADECAWLDSVERFVTNGTTSDSASLTWSAFHSQRQPENGINSAVTGQLPLLCESSNNFSMIKHATDVIKVAIDHLHPGQTTVVACDQYLFALAKIIRWNFRIFQTCTVSLSLFSCLEDFTLR